MVSHLQREREREREKREGKRGGYPLSKIYPKCLGTTSVLDFRIFFQILEYMRMHNEISRGERLRSGAEATREEMISRIFHPGILNAHQVTP
jgi:hypothetical protein